MSDFSVYEGQPSPCPTPHIEAPCPHSPYLLRPLHVTGPGSGSGFQTQLLTLHPGWDLGVRKCLCVLAVSIAF